MATLTVEVPESVAAALSSRDSVELSAYTISHVLRDELVDIREMIQVLDESDLSDARDVGAQLRLLADRLTRCADAFEAVAS